MLFTLFSYYNFERGCVEFKTVDNLDCVGDGKTNAAAVLASLERVNSHLLGTATDNAGDVLVAVRATEGRLKTR